MTNLSDSQPAIDIFSSECKWFALDEIHKIGELTLIELEVAQTLSVLVVVQLATNNARTELGVVSSMSPGN